MWSKKPIKLEEKNYLNRSTWNLFDVHATAVNISDLTKVYWRLCVKIHCLGWYNSWSMFETSSKADKKWVNIWCRQFSSNNFFFFFFWNFQTISDPRNTLRKNGDHLWHIYTTGRRAHSAWAEFIRTSSSCWSISSRQILSSNIQCKFGLIFHSILNAE